MRRQGRVDEAAAILVETIQVSRERAYEAPLLSALLELAWIYAQSDPERSGEVLGAIEQRKTAVRIAPFYAVASTDQLREFLSERVGKAALEAALARGRLRSIDQLLTSESLTPK
jgi:hypothetical protein